jgi:hypothetical protein
MGNSVGSKDVSLDDLGGCCGTLEGNSIVGHKGGQVGSAHGQNISGGNVSSNDLRER